MLLRLLRTLPALCIAGAILLHAPPAAAQAPGVQIGFCPGAPGHLVTITIKVVIACPTPTTLTVTVTAPCDDAAAVMGAVDVGMGGLNLGGLPIFGPPVVVPGGVPGQNRHEFPLSLAFLNSNCDFVSIDIDFDCGTMGMAVLIPGCHGCPGLVHPVLKLHVGGPPPGPSVLAIKIAGCPLLFVPLDGTETPAGVKAKILAALLAAGYVAHIDADGNVVIDLDCAGLPASGIDEYGLVGGLPMLLGMGSCPLPHPTPAHHGTWGSIKAIYR